MPKLFTVQIEVPSGSRTSSYKDWLNKQLEPHRMKVTSVEWSQELDDHYFNLGERDNEPCTISNADNGDAQYTGPCPR